MWDEGLTFQRTVHPDIFQLNNQDDLDQISLAEFFDEVIKQSRLGDVSGILTAFDHKIPGAQIRKTPPSDLTSIN